ncbi:hypothetical protein [Aureimonas frigidaquae]|uniref:hypothetical protein n=1 Tax=Aureimonas frigidaquae TaxID=424757 RepID=UPI0007828E9A|nr:hypothetical protein [Aureimonas frigidaquae]
MAIVTTTQSLGPAWTAVATGSTECLLQRIGGADVYVRIAAAEPTQADGHLLTADNDSFAVAGLTTESVYARAAMGSASLAITKKG